MHVGLAPAKPRRLEGKSACPMLFARPTESPPAVAAHVLCLSKRLSAAPPGARVGHRLQPPARYRHRSPPPSSRLPPRAYSTQPLLAMSAAQCISSANDLLAAHSALINRVRQTQKAHRRQLRALASPPHDILNIPLIPSPLPSPPLSRSPSPSLPPKPKPFRADLPPAKRARVARYDNYVPEEETIRNDYSARYVDTGEWPQNWVLGADPDHRFEEYVFGPLPLPRICYYVHFYMCWDCEKEPTVEWVRSSVVCFGARFTTCLHTLRHIHGSQYILLQLTDMS